MTRYQEILGQFRTGCVFCEPDPELVATSEENLYVIFDVAPLTPGHLIVHSREHHACAGELPGVDLPMVRKLMDEVKSIVRSRFGTATAYEHGRAGHCLSDGPEHRLCHHFHLHCVPGDYRLGDTLAERFERIPVRDYEQMGELYEQYGDYLYLESDDGQGSYFVVSEAIERHLMRTLIADLLGAPERASWRNYRDSHLLTEGMQALAGPLGRLRSAPATTRQPTEQ